MGVFLEFVLHLFVQRFSVLHFLKTVLVFSLTVQKNRVNILEVLIIKTYSFRTGKGDEKIDELLSSMSASRRSRYIKDAVLFYANVGEEIKLLNVRVNQALAGNPIQVQGNLNPATVADNNKRIKNLEDRVLASMESAFSLDD